MMRMFGVAVAAAALAATPAAAQTGFEVSIGDNVFEPAILEVDDRAFVGWTHDGAEQHTVTADDGSFDSGVLNPGDSFRVELGVVEEIPYHCTIHGGPDGVGMSGILLNEEVDTASADDGTDDELPTTGFTDIPGTGLILFSLSLIALGAYLTQVERLVYPERF